MMLEIQVLAWYRHKNVAELNQLMRWPIIIHWDCSIILLNYKKGALDSQLWFSPASSTTKTGRHDIAEILLKVAGTDTKMWQS
jgi:hypothetical protein